MAKELAQVPPDYAVRVRQFRGRLGLTQTELAARLGIAFASVNRWENSQTKPSRLAWSQLLKMGESNDPVETAARTAVHPPRLAFTASPDVVRVLAEGERL